MTTTPTFYDVFHKACTDRGKSTLFLYKNEFVWQTITWQDALAHTHQAIKRLTGIGLKSCMHVVLLADNSPEWILAYAAIHACGGVVVPVDPLLSTAEIAAIVQHSDSRILILGQTCAHLAPEITHDQVVAVRTLSELFDLTDHTLDVFSVTPLPHNELASIIYTSGSTGSPKAVMLTHANMAALASALDDRLYVGPEDRTLALLPLHHVFGFCANTYFPILRGCSFVFVESFKSEAILEAIAQGQPTILVMVPQILDLFVSGIQARIQAFSLLKRTLTRQALRAALFCVRNRWPNPFKLMFGAVRARFGPTRLLVSGGSHLNPDTFFFYAAMGLHIIEGYGLTETASAVIATYGEPIIPPGSIGTAVKAVKVRIDQPDEQGIGEICVQGPMVMQGYYKEPELTAAVIREGWFHTGDLGTINSDGQVTIAGRSKHVIVLSSGKNVYPDELAEYYLRHTALIEEICVFGRRVGTEERVAALIYPRQQYRQLPLADLIAQMHAVLTEVNRGLPTYKIISEWKLNFEALPKTTTRKVVVHKVQALYENLPAPDFNSGNRDAHRDAEFRASDLGRRLISGLIQLNPNIDKTTVGHYSHLTFDLGLDSLTRLDLICFLERQFSIAVSDTAAFQFERVSDIVAFVNTALSSGLPRVDQQEVFTLPTGVYNAVRQCLYAEAPRFNLFHTIRKRLFAGRANTVVGQTFIPLFSPYILGMPDEDSSAWELVAAQLPPAQKEKLVLLTRTAFPHHPGKNLILDSDMQAVLPALIAYILENQHRVMVETALLAPLPAAGPNGLSLIRYPFIAVKVHCQAGQNSVPAIVFSKPLIPHKLTQF